MTKQHKPGDIIAYHRRPRHKDEILSHNQVIHFDRMLYGANGFRWFTCRAGGHWKKCPCGWRPDLGVHHASPEHVEWTRKKLKKLGSQEAFNRYIVKRMITKGLLRTVVFGPVVKRMITKGLLRTPPAPAQRRAGKGW